MSDQEGRWLTYAEAGQLLGVSAEAARQMARRRGWPRRTPNERGAVAHILLPDDLDAVRPRTALNGVRPATGDGPDTPLDVLRTVRDTVELMLAPLRADLEHERRRADAAAAQVDRERERADMLRGQLTDALGRAERAERRVDELDELTAELHRQRWSWRFWRRKRPG